MALYKVQRYSLSTHFFTELTDISVQGGFNIPHCPSPLGWGPASFMSYLGFSISKLLSFTYMSTFQWPITTNSKAPLPIIWMGLVKNGARWFHTATFKKQELLWADQSSDSSVYWLHAFNTFWKLKRRRHDSCGCTRYCQWLLFHFLITKSHTITHIDVSPSLTSLIGSTEKRSKSTISYMLGWEFKNLLTLKSAFLSCHHTVSLFESIWPCSFSFPWGPTSNIQLFRPWRQCFAKARTASSVE